MLPSVNVPLNIVVRPTKTIIQHRQDKAVILEQPPHVLDQVISLIGFGVYDCRCHRLWCIDQHRPVVWVQLQCHIRSPITKDSTLTRLSIDCCYDCIICNGPLFGCTPHPNCRDRPLSHGPSASIVTVHNLLV